MQMPRDDEEFCKNGVLWHLTGYGHIATAVRTLPPSPDYALTVDGTEDGLEVSTIVDTLEVPNEGRRSRLLVEAGLQGIVDEAERIAKERGML